MGFCVKKMSTIWGSWNQIPLQNSVLSGPDIVSIKVMKPAFRGPRIQRWALLTLTLMMSESMWGMTLNLHPKNGHAPHFHKSRSKSHLTIRNAPSIQTTGALSLSGKRHSLRFYPTMIRLYRPWRSKRHEIDDAMEMLIQRAALTHGLDPKLLHAVIRAESGYNPHAVSDKGAMGLMQLMPGTASRFGAANPYDPEQNVKAGARYLKELLEQFDNDLVLSIAAYNAGEKNIQKYGYRIPPFQETQEYVRRVLEHYGREGR